jgi:hypothetical protein
MIGVPHSLSRATRSLACSTRGFALFGPDMAQCTRAGLLALAVAAVMQLVGVAWCGEPWAARQLDAGAAAEPPADSPPVDSPPADEARLQTAPTTPVAQQAPTAPHITLVVGRKAEPLVHRAARELAGLLARLYGAAIDVAHAPPPQAGPLVLLGNPDDNPAIAAAFGEAWPRLSEQGILLRSLENPPALVVGGGSPRATLWAVYELGRRLGITYLLSGDVYPAAPRAPFATSGYNVLLEPHMANRVFATLGDEPIGPSSWGIAEQCRVLEQLAKLKYNGVLLLVHPWQPFVDFSVDGTAKRHAQLWRRTEWPVGGDTAGRAAFGGARQFVNPDLAGWHSYEDLTAAGIELVRGIVTRAHELGMWCGLMFAPVEVPHDFGGLLGEAQSPAGAEGLSLIPAAAGGGQERAWLAVAAAQWRAYATTYAGVDVFYLRLPEQPVWVDRAAAAWEELTGGRRGRLEQLIERLPAAERAGVGPLLRGHVSSLGFLRRLVEDVMPLAHPERRLYIWGVHPVIHSALGEWLPPHAGVVVEGISNDRAAEGGAAPFAALPADRPRMIWLELGTSGGGTFLTLESAATASALRAAHQGGCEGFIVECRVAADQEFTLHLLSRASFEPEVEPREVVEGLIGPMCGEGVAERVVLAFDRIERAGRVMARHDAHWGRPGPEMVLQHAVAEPAPDWWAEAATLYTDAANELYRAADRSRVEGRPYLRRLIRRCEWAWYYFQSLAALRAAEQVANDPSHRTVQLEAAVEHMYNGLSGLSEAAQDNSTRAVIAVLNEFGYRPLAARLEEAEKE